MKESNILVHILNRKYANWSVAKHQRKLMKKSNTLAKIAAIKQFEKKVLKNTKSQCMKESSTLANIAAMEQLQREILKNSKSQYIKESSNLAKILDMMNQLQKLVHGCVKFHCKHCSHKADKIRLPKVSTWQS